LSIRSISGIVLGLLLLSTCLKAEDDLSTENYTKVLPTEGEKFKFVNYTFSKPLDVSDDGKYGVSLNEYTCRYTVWDLQNKKEKFSHEHRGGWYGICPASVSISPDSKFVAMAISGNHSHNSVNVVDINTGKTLIFKGGDVSSYNRLAFSADNKRLYAIGAYGHILVINLKTKKSKEIDIELRDYKTVELSPKGDVIAFLGGGKSVFVNSANGKTIRAFDNHLPNTVVAQWDSTGKKIASGDSDGKVTLWNASTGKTISVNKIHNRAITDIKITKDDQYVISSTKKEIRKWNLATKEILSTIQGYFDYVSFNVDGMKMLSVEGNEVKISDLEYTEPLIKNKMFSHFQSVTGYDDWDKLYRFYVNVDRISQAQFYDKLKHQIENKAYSLVQGQNTIEAFERYINKYKKTPMVEAAVTVIYQLVNKKDTIEGYDEFLLSYSSSKEAAKAVSAIYALVSKTNTITAYEEFLAKRGSSAEASEAITAIYTLVSQENTISAYEEFLAKQGTSKEAEQAVAAIYTIVSKEHTVVSYEQFLTRYHASKEASKAVSAIYQIVQKENNIAGLKWFMVRYAKSPEAKKALQKIHLLAWEIANDIDTIGAYNDFVIAYPTAKQIKQAIDKSYGLEKSEYAGMMSFFSEEKEARRLLVASKILEQSSDDLSRDEKVGYMMVVNRMNDLLKQEFNSTDAALRHLESNEFKSFVRSFKSSMQNLKRELSKIADRTADLSSIIQRQSKMMNDHFENAARDRDTAAEMSKQHRIWERFIGEVGQ